jgi:class 3 adenylate cyclase/tetratricopeptide (TPR) repeat protein
VICSACGTENREGGKFCTECGASLALVRACAACGAPHEPGQRFCAECGARLLAPAATATAEPTAELRLASVLFVDLVGYTSLSETRDAEDVRDLLSRYFDQARTIIRRYGGTVEKFIGDAVMAVWGAPVAREDDAERAVRAALELVDAVAAFGESVGAPQLRARAGVVTGQVASLANPGEGLVVGDRVNTASRVQSTAEPGTVYVDEVTRQASSAAIAYADAGEHAVKGKAGPLRLWRALRVVAGAGGAQPEEGLAAPFLGRDPELRMIKELFHTAVDRGRPRLITVSGAAGVGKSRLQMEFVRYVDGLADTILWHSGRCLSYGDGVAYWALAEMVRQRMGIEEDASPELAEAKLAAGLDRWLTDPAERAFVGERVRTLLGLAEPGLSRAELFAGWRLLFERLAEQSPVVLAFEDVQWADDGLLDFVDHLLDWSGSPIVVIACARTELIERRPTWASGRAGVSPIFLEPLPGAVIGELLDAMVTGLPAAVRERLVAQAEGMALYALESVRALLDRGLLGDDGGRLVVRGEIGEELAVPASLTSLLTARLDALEPDERALVKDLAVLGGSFPRATVGVVSETPDARLDELLTSLVRKDVLAVRADPLSPDRGQYQFAQTLLRSVAYDMLSRHERKPRHLAVAAHVRSTEGEELAELVAAHLLAAYRAAAGDPDEEALREQALSALRRGAQRAASIGAPEVAAQTLLGAVELARGDRERAELLAASAERCEAAGRPDEALERFEAAVAALEAAGEAHGALLLEAPIALQLNRLGRNREAGERAEAALEALGPDAPGEELAPLVYARGAALCSAGDVATGELDLQRAVVLAQAYELPALLTRSLAQRAIACAQLGRVEEARILYGGAAELADRPGLEEQQTRALLNLGDLLWRYDRPGADETSRQAMAAGRRLGNRILESVAAGNLIGALISLGRLDEAETLGHEMLAEGGTHRPERETVHFRLVVLHLLRGELEAAREHLDGMAPWRESDEVEAVEMLAVADLSMRLVSAPSTELADTAVERLREFKVRTGSEGLRQLLGLAVRVVMDLGLTDRAAAILDAFADEPPGTLPPSAKAQLAILRGWLASEEGDGATAEAELGRGVRLFEPLEQPYGLAAARAALAAWLLSRGRTADAAPLLEQAATTFQELRAAPALDRVLRLRDEQPQDAISA